MSVKIRLAQTGKKNQISYRIVAIDTRTKRDGKFLEILGFYNPKSGSEEKLRIEKEKIAVWVKKGAQITPSVALLIEKGTLDKPKKPKVKKEEAAPAAAPQAPAPEEVKPEEVKEDKPTAEEPVEEKKEEVKVNESAEPEAEKPAEVSKTEEVPKEVREEKTK